MTDKWWWWVRADVAEGAAAYANALREWWTPHAVEFAREQHASSAWRLELETPSKVSTPTQEYAAIYELTSTAPLDSFLEPPVEADWAPYQKVIANWTDTIYRVLHEENEDDNRGDYWAIASSLQADRSPHQALDGQWGSDRGSALATAAGCHHVWLVETFRHPIERGMPEPEHLLICQIDEPASFPRTDDESISFYHLALAFISERIKVPSKDSESHR